MAQKRALFAGLETRSWRPKRLDNGTAQGAEKRGPAQPKAKRAPRGPADQRTRKLRRLPGPSGDPRGHIQRWLAPGVAAEQMGQEGGPASKGEHARHAPLRSSPLADCGMGSQPGPGSVPGVPGSSTDPPQGFSSAEPWALPRVIGALAMAANR